MQAQVLAPGEGETIRPGFEIKVGRPELVVTEGTVKTHLTHVYRKLDTHSRTQALVRARELALI